MKKKIKLNILGLSYSRTQSGAYALVLSEENGPRRIPIIIGNLEAQSIAIKIEGLQPSRPLTHDLFFNFAQSFDIDVLEVTIYKLEEGIFYSELICTKGNDVIHIDSRTSDAIAIALRFGCPIYTFEEIIEKSGIILDFKTEGGEKENDDDNEKEGQGDEAFSFEDSKETSLAEKSEIDLQQMLKEAVQDEDYEFASKIQKEIDTRRTK